MERIFRLPPLYSLQALLTLASEVSSETFKGLTENIKKYLNEGMSPLTIYDQLCTRLITGSEYTDVRPRYSATDGSFRIVFTSSGQEFILAYSTNPREYRILMTFQPDYLEKLNPEVLNWLEKSTSVSRTVVD